MVTPSSFIPPPGLTPAVGSVYSHAWKMLWKPFWWLLLMMVISWAMGAVYGWTPVPGAIVTVLITGPLSYGMNYAFLKASRGEIVKIELLFYGFQNYLNVVLAYFLTLVFVIAGFICLFFPGIYIACKLAFVPYIVMDKKLPYMDAIRLSWNMTNGFGWRIFFIGLLGIVVMIAGFICLGVGAIIAGMWISLTLASLYYVVDFMSLNPSSPPQTSN